MEILEKLPGVLLPWYDQSHRKLPWRQTQDPYRIWISEIMLQQTRVEAVKGYYARFLETCPDVATLANTPDDVLHKLWEGLGYYSRVRNLKKAAIVIMQEYGGVFPVTQEQILKLPGIGDEPIDSAPHPTMPVSIPYERPLPLGCYLRRKADD